MINDQNFITFFKLKSGTPTKKPLTPAGHYLMVNGYYGGENHISEISSPHMPAVNSGCKVKFNYQMTGYVGGSLHIFLTLHGMKGRYWSISGDQVRSLKILRSSLT